MSLFSKWFSVFRTGDYGDKGSYSPADLEQIAANYDPNLHEAPVVLGHPQTDSPAYGWVEALRAVGDTLEAKLKQVDPALQNLVKDGRFKKLSIALYKDLAGKGLYLRHLGFLGAVPPEVKGLQPAFQEAELSEYVVVEEPGAPRRYSEVDMLIEVGAARKVAREIMEQAFAESQARAKKKEEIRVFVETLRGHAGKFPALAMPGLREFIEALPDTPSIEFGEGANKQTKSASEIFRSFVERLPSLYGSGPARIM